MFTFFIIVVCLVVVGVIIGFVFEAKHVSSLSPSEKVEYQAKRTAETEGMLHGPFNSELVCPHCQTKGKVRTQKEVRKAGVSGGKATGALLTGGVSLLATGLSRKEIGTKAFCGNCKSIWFF